MFAVERKVYVTISLFKTFIFIFLIFIFYLIFIHSFLFFFFFFLFFLFFSFLFFSLLDYLGEVYKFFETMKLEGFLPSIYTLSLILKSCSLNGFIRGAQSIMKEIKSFPDVYGPPNYHIYFYLIKTYAYPKYFFIIFFEEMKKEESNKNNNVNLYFFIC
jgi:hypothetical protein